jgi:uncharacterized membrane protein HdeD (DUF308 family)
MNSNDIQKLIGVTLGIAGVVAAGKALQSRVNSVEKQGLTCVTGALLVVAAITFFSRLDQTAGEVKELLA